MPGVRPGNRLSEPYLGGITPRMKLKKNQVQLIANWSGQWPGLVGMLNLNGSLTKAGVKYSTLWSENFGSPEFGENLATWLKTGRVKHKLDHITPLKKVKIPGKYRKTGEALAEQL